MIESRGCRPCRVHPCFEKLCIDPNNVSLFTNPVFNDLFYALFPVVQNAENILSLPVTNQFVFSHFGQTGAVDSPNFDTLYSAALLDFRTVTQITLNVPEIGTDPWGDPRYYSFAFVDVNLDVFAYIGKRLQGNPPATSYTIGLGDENDVVVPSTLVVLIYRLYADIYDPLDIAEANVLRVATTLTPNSAIGTNDAILITAVRSKNPPLDVQYFLEQAQRALAFQPEPVLQTVVDALLVDADQSRVFNALQGTFTQAQASIETEGEINNGTWVRYAADLQIGDASPLLSFATVQWNVLYANESAEAIYYLARFSNLGLPFNGHREYTLTLPELPPVNGFWSLTAYAKDGFVPLNESERYTVGTSSQPLQNDGTNYKIFIGQTNPEAPVENNYLQPPAENGIYFILRLYIPLTQTYEPPPIRLEPFP